MYPVLFRIGSIEITSFGLLVAIGALVGLWVFRRELRASNLPDSALDAAMVGIIGGLVGAKLLWTAEHRGEEPLLDLLLSRGGLSWFGGLAGGVGGGLLFIWWRQLPAMEVIAAATPALAIGHAIGRIGCLLVGDDYGRPSSLPWAIAFPEGLPPTSVPVHPTQIYEAVLLVPLAFVLMRWRRQHRPAAFVLGGYLLLAGAIRFGIEFLRVNTRVVGPLSVAHIASILAMLVGLFLIASLSRYRSKKAVTAA
jgi:phosphatidylglycerol---prolipoprotein diacylglyceryl transferase